MPTCGAGHVTFDASAARYHGHRTPRVLDPAERLVGRPSVGLYAIIWLAVESSRIGKVKVLADPDKMYFLAKQLLSAVAGNPS